jgi:hypothetical protein
LVANSAPDVLLTISIFKLILLSSYRRSELGRIGSVLT